MLDWINKNQYLCIHCDASSYSHLSNERLYISFIEWLHIVDKFYKIEKIINSYSDLCKHSTKNRNNIQMSRSKIPISAGISGILFANDSKSQHQTYPFEAFLYVFSFNKFSIHFICVHLLSHNVVFFTSSSLT